MAATLLLEKKEDRKKQQRDNTNGAQTDSGFSSKSENIKAEKISENNTTGEKSSKQSKTAEQQNSETSSENQDMDVDKPNIRGMYKLLKNLLIFFLLFYTICRKTRVKKFKVFWQTIVKKPKKNKFSCQPI